MDRYDVAIVGGGPAGACAARVAAQQGARTILFESGVPREDRDSPGPDSTDAAALLDYWVDIADLDYDSVPDDVILRELEQAAFVSPQQELVIDRTGIDSTHPSFGFTFNRVKMDDWLHEQAKETGAELEVGTSVRSVNPDQGAIPEHRLQLSTGEEVIAKSLILADGPQRRITNGTLDDLLPVGKTSTDYLGTQDANHIAYQEHRRVPEELFEDDTLRFWWGAIPGETAYPWVFPNDENIARIGLTMPIGLGIDDVEEPSSYTLVDYDDDELPSPQTYIERLLEREYPEYDISDFPRVESRGKRKGTETYSISSTKPIDSPVGANIAVAGGAMGSTSAFHEGGYHTAMRTGKIAGYLAANDSLEQYNDAWKAAIGTEVIRNIIFAEFVRDYKPADWDKAFSIAKELQSDSGNAVKPSLSAGLTGLSLFGKYKLQKLWYRYTDFVQIKESDYIV